ncbi:hypothetical protein [Kitasatospora cineracea]|uniref:Uncharacterized protein n=1 Tax=Kitasatospora cineracea TaxID=88074 RepID=A0A3N4R9R4_9ACTN|nr:hypothetical protein [Kitasatospora cineracea]RPE27341.1 hypothetical protein EDD38_7486 [Kitasatospora cineracea]
MDTCNCTPSPCGHCSCDTCCDCGHCSAGDQCVCPCTAAERTAANCRPQRPDLGAIQTRTNAATPGPWYPQPDYGNDFIATQIGGYEHGIGWLNFGAGSQARADREFVTAARTDVPALLAYARHLEARAASLEAERDGWAENSRNEARIWTARVAELEQQLAQAQAEQHQYYTALQGVARNSPPARDGR